MQFFMSTELNSGPSSSCPVCLWMIVCDSVTKKKLTLIGHNFWTETDRDFIFGMYTQLIKPLQMTS